MRTIEIKTALPGPRSAEILRRKQAVVADPLSIYAPVVVESARGATVTDVDGNTFLDFMGGVGCLNVGHAPPRVTAARPGQAEGFRPTGFSAPPPAPSAPLAE